jgi:hypothetical protein
MAPRLLAFCGVSALATARAAECTDPASCKADEDVAMLQFAKVGRAHPPLYPEGKTFVKESRPFFATSKDGLLSTSEQGAIIIDEDGQLNTYYLPGATTINGGTSVEYRPPYRFYLMKEPTTDYSDASKFYKPYFPGKTFSVDMDFGPSGPSCGCNLNWYLVDMPVHEEGKDHDYYCDAQCFPGLGCCAEFDMNEGNNKVQQITNHACTHNYGGHPDWACHKWGEPELKTHKPDFGPGAGHTIDSTKPFTFSQRFDVNGEDFTFTTTMDQEGRQVSLTMGPGNEQLNAMLRELEKTMAFVTGYWFAQDMNWMDGEQCGQGAEHCNLNPAWISNWRLTSNGSPVPSPPPPPSPSPAPTPSPAPVPTPTQGKCCWGQGCTACQEDLNNWCNQGGKVRCESGCGGHWC